MRRAYRWWQAIEGLDDLFEVFKATALLKKLCDHPLLCLPRDEHGELLQKKVVQNGEVNQSKTAASCAFPSRATPSKRASFDEGVFYSGTMIEE
eukprot:187537-Prymnesium_polylepis.1